jgi:hypothetical protein
VPSRKGRRLVNEEELCVMPALEARDRFCSVGTW